MTTLKKLIEATTETIARYKQTDEKYRVEIKSLYNDVCQLRTLFIKKQMKLSEKIHERLQDLMPDAKIYLKPETYFKNFEYGGRIIIDLEEKDISQLSRLCTPIFPERPMSIACMGIDYGTYKIFVTEYDGSCFDFPIEDEHIKKLLHKIKEIHDHRAKLYENL